MLPRTALLFAAPLLLLFAAQTADTPTQAGIFTKSFSLPESGEARLRLTADAPGCAWSKNGAESAVVSVLVDGDKKADVVLFDGQHEHQYDLFLGSVNKGPHKLTLLFRPDVSPHGAAGSKPRVQKADVSLAPYKGAEADVWKHLPLLYGRTDNATTDTPLLAFYTVHDNESTKQRSITYSVIWSNEDGGTGNDLGSLVARWGRSTDIEWVYEVTLQKPGGPIEDTAIQGDGHKTRPFAGTYIGGHPVLRTSTTNNMVSDAGTSPLLFALAPVRALEPAKETREAIMDAQPWSHRIAGEEMQRENKWEAVGDPQTLAASDGRNYLYVDYHALPLPPGALVAVQVTLRSGDRFVSDHNRKSDAIGRSGWVRTTVELPPGTNAKAVREVAFVRRDTGHEQEAVPIKAARAFFLDHEFRPEPPFLSWAGNK